MDSATKTEKIYILVSDDLDGLASALILKQVLGEATIMVCGAKEDPLDQVLESIASGQALEIWIAGLCPTEENRVLLDFQQMRLINSGTWINWLSHQRWPYQKKQWFRQFSRVKVVNDLKRRSFEICAAACLSYPRPDSVLAVCAAAYGMPQPDRTTSARLRGKLLSLKGRTAKAHRAAEKWLTEFEPTPERIATLLISAKYAPLEVGSRQIELLTGRHKTPVVRIDLTGRTPEGLSAMQKRNLAAQVQQNTSAYAALIAQPENQVFLTANGHRLPEAADLIAEKFNKRIISAKGNSQTRTITFADDKAAEEAFQVLADLPHQPDPEVDLGTVQGWFETGIIAFNEGRLDQAGKYLKKALDDYLEHQDFESEAPPHYLHKILPWALYAETTLYCLGDR